MTMVLVGLWILWMWSDYIIFVLVGNILKNDNGFSRVVNTVNVNWLYYKLDDMKWMALDVLVQIWVVPCSVEVSKRCIYSSVEYSVGVLEDMCGVNQKCV